MDAKEITQKRKVRDLMIEKQEFIFVLSKIELYQAFIPIDFVFFDNNYLSQ